MRRRLGRDERQTLSEALDNPDGELLYRVEEEQSDGSEMLTGWVDSADVAQWRHEVQQITEALGPLDHEQ